jgi:hypothetical protein
MKNITFVIPLLLFCFLTSAGRNTFDSTGHLKITFVNYANGKALSFDSAYYTPSGEYYKLTKLRYYISNIVLPGNYKLTEQDNYHLVKQGSETSFIIPLKYGSYNNISFLLGIDSIHHCSGAQEGALDPMNDMFWTWNSGYVIFKMEGTSPSSPADLNRIEHHIGGYRFNNNVSTIVNLKLGDNFIIDNSATKEILIRVNLDEYWNAVNKISIHAIPVCSTPGETAKKIAANFNSMFSISN